MQNFKQNMNNLIHDESGQDLIEYALVAALVGLGAVVTLKTVAGKINAIFSGISSALTSAA